MVAVGRERGARIHVAERFDVAASGRFDELALDLAGFRVGEEQIEGESVTLRQHHELGTIGRERGREVPRILEFVVAGQALFQEAVIS